MKSAIARGLAYAPYADLIWCETSEPNMEEARRLRRPSREVSREAAGLQLFTLFQLEEETRRRTIARFQRDLAKMGYKFQFVTLAGFHALNLSMFELARGYGNRE